jgi:hypothetical protein
MNSLNTHESLSTVSFCNSASLCFVVSNDILSVLQTVYCSLIFVKNLVSRTLVDSVRSTLLRIRLLSRLCEEAYV